MLSDLMPDSRWKLLKALWLDSASGSVHALAKQNQLSYSSAHAELKRLERASFARSRAVGNSLVFEANRPQRAEHAIEELVRASAETESLEGGQLPLQVMADLASLGAPVRAESAPASHVVPEETVAQGLRLTHRDPALARVYPVLLARNRDRLDLERLKQRASALKEQRTLGFFLELTGELARDKRLRAFAQTLRDRRVRKVRDFFEGPHGKYSQDLANRRTPQLAKDWHFRMDMDMENFRSMYSKFCGRE
jgi:hypothetical protein